jgi:hypothetical protein
MLLKHSLSFLNHNLITWSSHDLPALYFFTVLLPVEAPELDPLAPIGCPSILPQFGSDKFKVWVIMPLNIEKLGPRTQNWIVWWSCATIFTSLVSHKITDGLSENTPVDSRTVFVGNNMNSPIRTSAIGLLQHLQLLYIPSELDIDKQIQQVILYFYYM